jgi:uncharacterized protein
MTFLTYTFLYLTVLLLWLPTSNIKYTRFVFLTITIVLGLINKQLGLISLAPILALMVALRYTKPNCQYNIQCGAKILALLISVGLAMHFFPGFQHLLIFNAEHIGTNAIPYTLFLNIDSTIAGILILGLSCTLIDNWNDWVLLAKQLLPILLISIPIIIALAIILGFVQFDPKIPNGLFIWALTNLLFISMTEEAIFRALIQRNIYIVFSNYKFAKEIAIVSAALLFGFIHFPGGAKYVLLAAVAGVVYGWTYAFTKRIEASIITHFTVNLTHYLFFTYPALASAIIK